ncbi:hypothetical protein Taro_034804 [Colocasia esculenta]|uniref:ZF-HD dimerization-type domain-containing protein n=1 Tax=Colocasia esculenta TaxID=4460 RepID=A0A843W8P2_COLES|nr:hypothetical protein [Colocasia esculenta]
MDLSDHEREMPIPISSTYVSAHGHGHDPGLRSSNGLFSSPPEEGHRRGTSCSSNKGAAAAAAAAAAYRECLKNHAASLGGKALDGCGEFMPGGAEGTLEAFRCSACGCHRNFHRKVVEGELLSYDSYRPKGRKLVGQKGVLISASDAYGYYPAGNSFISAPSPHQMIMPLGALQSCEWPEEVEGGGGSGAGVPTRAAPVAKKRFRTKFTPEQKEKMLAFAEKMDWRLQREEEGLVQQFCQEIGVKRRVLKVWMHNNKQNLAARKSSLPPSPPPPPPA